MSIDPQVLQAYMAMAGKQQPQQAANTGMAGGITQLLAALMQARAMKQQQKQNSLQPVSLNTNTTPMVPPTPVPDAGSGVGPGQGLQ